MQKNNSQIGFVPAGVRSSKKFGERFERHFFVPKHLRNVSADLVDTVNDWHFAMLNDTDRNNFYYSILSRAIIPGKTKVLEIGAGSGILSLMAALLGAKSVLAIEGSSDLANLAEQNIAKNNFQDRVRVVRSMSTKVSPRDFPEWLPADILVSEIFGTLLLGESALDYIQDAISRKLVSGPHILPRYGRQMALLIESDHVRELTSAQSYKGIDLSMINQLRDTASVVFTKQYGFRLNSVPLKVLSEPITVFDLDFVTQRPGFVPQAQTKVVPITQSGRCDALVLYWEACDMGTEGQVMISTSPFETVDKFCRDLQWGQAVQLVNFGDGIGAANDVEAGSSIELTQRCSADSVLLQFTFRRI